MTRRRAVIVTAGQIDPRDDLPLAVSAEPFEVLDFTTDRADEVEQLLTRRFDFDVHRKDNARSIHLAELHETRPEQISIFHFIGHGTVREDGLHFVPTNRNYTPLTCLNAVIARLNEIQAEEPDHHYMVILDLCEAGKGLDSLPHGSAKNIWIVCAADDERTYAGQFSRSFAEVLKRIDTGDAEEFIPMDRLWREVSAHFRNALLKQMPSYRHDMDEAERHRLLRDLPTPRTLGRFSAYTEKHPPFFPNKRYTPVAAIEESAREAIDVRLHPFLDAPHFADRVGTHFTGRKNILRALGAWRTEPDPEIGLHLITGAAGSGKSTVAGVVVLTCQPDILASDHYNEARERLSKQLPDAFRVPVRVPVAAVHARQLQLDKVLRGFIEQLAAQGVLDPTQVSTAAELAEWTRTRPEPPIFVLDALDEASRPDDLVHVLLRPLLATRRDGWPASRVLVAGRNDTPRNNELLRLLAVSASKTHQFDLNEIDPAEAQDDLSAFLENTVRTEEVCCQANIPRFAREVAEAMVARTDPSEHGLFLTAGLYAANLGRRFEHSSNKPETHVPEHLDLAAEAIPMNLPEVLELDFASVLDPDERRARRAIMAALAHAHGQGMPATIAGMLAKNVFNGGNLDATELLRGSKGIKVYLRSDTDPSDDAPLYRLFHQGLTDYLRAHPITPERNGHE